jgi:hypothetical protein
MTPQDYPSTKGFRGADLIGATKGFKVHRYFVPVTRLIIVVHVAHHRCQFRAMLVTPAKPSDESFRVTNG